MIAKRTKHNDRIYYQSFLGHIEDGLRILKAYFESKDQILTAFCQRWQLDPVVFRKNIYLTVVLHDIGKLTEEFQNNIKAGKRSSRHPHALFGMPVLQEIPYDQFENLPLCLFAILGHHTQLYRNIYNSTNIATKVHFHHREITRFVNQIMRELYDKLEFNNYFELPQIKIDQWSELTRDAIFERLILPFARIDKLGDLKTKSIFTYLFSILQLCDDYSSAHFHQFIEKNTPTEQHFDSVITDTSAFVYDLQLPLEEYKKRLFNGHSLRTFQEEIAKKSAKNSFLFAPCGRGKTEAALWWAFHLKEKLHKDRIIFALPTQVTCNAMYERLADVYNFGEKHVGLFHGKSKIALKYRKNQISIDDACEIQETIDFKDYDIIKDENFKGNVFFKPITVTTIDHLAYSFVHGFSQSDFACGNLQNAVIIFDEVHYYELHTLNNLLRVFSYLRKMDIPHLLMTGTAPQFLLEKISKDYELITDREGLVFQPFILKKETEIPILDSEEVLHSIYSNYQSERNIFVILNQVAWAQKFYEDTKSYFDNKNISPNLILYHSRFIHRDRVRKEMMIREAVKKKPCIIIATQVIEISLDISSDVMYSTVAPPDAIGQRAGRLNRGGKYYKNGYTFELRLFNADHFMPYPEQILNDCWQKVKEGAISYQYIKELCDEVYQDYRLKPDKKYGDFFERNILFGNYYKEVVYSDEEGKALKIRDDSYQQIDVVPSRVFEEARKKVKDCNAMWAEFKVKIPFKWVVIDYAKHGVRYNFTNHDDYYVIECDFDYNFYTGIQPDKSPYKRPEFL